MKQNSTFLLILLTALAISVITSCKKTEPNPCEGLLNESPPSEIIVQVIDKETGKTLVVDAAVIKITEKQSENPYTNWNIYNRAASSPLNGAVSLTVFHENPGEYQYDIQLGNVGMSTLSYQISREETGNPCNPFGYPIGDIKIVNLPFDVFQYEGKTYPKILIVPL